MTTARTAPSLRFILWTCLALTAVLGSRGIIPAAGHPQPAQDDRYGKLPLYFVENRGQTDERVEYYLQGKDKSIYFTPHGLVFSLPGKPEGNLTTETRRHGEDHGEEGQRGSVGRSAELGTRNSKLGTSTPQRYLLNLEFGGANPDVRLEGAERTPALISYIKGPKKHWKTGLKTYSSVVYRNLWPGIDLEYRGTQDRLKYQFIVHPGADPGQIRLRYHGATDLRVNAAGELEVEIPAGGFHDQKPYSYQEVAGRQVEVPTTYSLNTSTPQHPNTSTPTTHEYGFEVGEYDRSLPLVIDPAMLVYAGYVGGLGQEGIGDGLEGGNGISVDGAGNAYITGTTRSEETSFPDGDPDMNDLFPVPGFDQTHNSPGAGGDLALEDAFVVKVNAAGTALVYATYLGGSGTDQGFDIAVDGTGNAYVAGSTSSSQATFPDGDPDMNDMFPVATGPDQTHNGGFEAFVAKLNPDGTALLYAGYIGGNAFDVGSGIAVDPDGNAYVTGVTNSTQGTFPDGDPDMNDMMPVPGFDQTLNSSVDAFAVKVNAMGTALLYATYLGGTGDERNPDIAVDGSGNAYITGETGSDQTTFPDGDPDMNDMFPAPGFDQTFNGGGQDAFVAKLNGAGTALVYASYLGGSGFDDPHGVAVDSLGNAYLTGSTGSTQTTFPDGDPDMNDMMPCPGFDQTFNGGPSDAFVAKMNAAGTALVYATYIGGATPGDIGSGIAVDQDGNAYVTGSTRSDQTSFPDGDPDMNDLFPVPGFDQTFNGFSGGFGGDAFVVKLEAAGTALVYAGYVGGSGDDSGQGIAVDAARNAYITGVTTSDQTSFPDGDPDNNDMMPVPGFDQTFNGGTDVFVAKLAEIAPPILTCPMPVVVTASSPAGAQVLLMAQVSDPDSSLVRVTWSVDGVLRQTEDIAITPGGPAINVSFNFLYPVGMHVVDVSASDLTNPPVTCQTTVTVNPPPNNPPTIPVCPVSQVVTATGPGGAQVVLEAQVADADGNPLTVTWNVDGGAPENAIPVPAGGPPTMATVPFTFLYSIGTHTVDVSVSDGIAPPVSCPQITITVNPMPPPPPNQPPGIACTGPQVVTATSAAGAAVTLHADVADADGDALTVTWTVDGVLRETDLLPAGGPPSAGRASFTFTYPVGVHPVEARVSDGVNPPVPCPTSVTVNSPPPPPAGGPGHAGGSGGIKTANGIGCFNFGVVGRLRGRASGALSFKEQAVNGSSTALFDGRSVRIDTATFGGTTGNLTLLVRGQMKTNRYGTVPFQVDALDRGTPGVPRDEFRLTVFADTNRDGIPEPVIFSGNLVTVRGKMNNISLRPNLPPH
jgi:beta-propeller repeat-containing protein